MEDDSVSFTPKGQEGEGEKPEKKLGKNVQTRVLSRRSHRVSLRLIDAAQDFEKSLTFLSER